MRPSELIALHYHDMIKIFRKYPEIKKAQLFGSASRGDDTEESDIDIILTYPIGTCLFTLGGLQDELDMLFPSKKIDLVSDRAFSHNDLDLKVIYEKDN